jgi:hypothetical protein
MQGQKVLVHSASGSHLFQQEPTNAELCELTRNVISYPDVQKQLHTFADHMLPTVISRTGSREDTSCNSPQQVVPNGIHDMYNLPDKEHSFKNTTGHMSDFYKQSADERYSSSNNCEAPRGSGSGGDYRLREEATNVAHMRDERGTDATPLVNGNGVHSNNSYHSSPHSSSEYHSTHLPEDEPGSSFPNSSELTAGVRLNDDADLLSKSRIIGSPMYNVFVISVEHGQGNVSPVVVDKQQPQPQQQREQQHLTTSTPGYVTGTADVAGLSNQILAGAVPPDWAAGGKLSVTNHTMPSQNEFAQKLPSSEYVNHQSQSDFETSDSYDSMGYHHSMSDGGIVFTASVSRSDIDISETLNSSRSESTTVEQEKSLISSASDSGLSFAHVDNDVEVPTGKSRDPIGDSRMVHTVIDATDDSATSTEPSLTTGFARSFEKSTSVLSNNSEDSTAHADSGLLLSEASGSMFGEGAVSLLQSGSGSSFAGRLVFVVVKASLT